MASQLNFRSLVADRTSHEPDLVTGPKFDPNSYEKGLCVLERYYREGQTLKLKPKI
ncbi:conserved hypothetical protein [Vibrio chagasii]|uniref:Uncharacterized protein n=1 Tax=Vibrio coralliirubri TaxID=1516159 RepID=A0AA86XWH3_9VIBR|nr:conserved hypothetical protein [Vibrio chagasii]CDT90957.1 hypothetical protein VCR29J2_80012 [Vibrio coralliirubri]CDU00125.1 hypothetical protein VCR31J2_80012 [Vibrio coralliirubri]